MYYEFWIPKVLCYIWFYSCFIFQFFDNVNHINRLWFLLESIGRYDLVNGVFLYSKFAEQKRKVYFDYDYSIRDE